jgi:DNA polymerase elongation subunit (family B)
MQTFESHIPYLLQFTSDYDILPMGFLHFSEQPTYRALCSQHLKETGALKGNVASAARDNVDNDRRLGPPTDIEHLLEGICTQDMIWTQDTTNPLGLKTEIKPPIIDGKDENQRDELSDSMSRPQFFCHEGVVIVTRCSCVLSSCEYEVNISISSILNRSPEQPTKTQSSGDSGSNGLSDKTPDEEPSCSLLCGFGSELWAEEAGRRVAEGLSPEVVPTQPSTQSLHRVKDTIEGEYDMRLQRLLVKGKLLHQLLQSRNLVQSPADGASGSAETLPATLECLTPFRRDVDMLRSINLQNMCDTFEDFKDEAGNAAFEEFQELSLKWMELQSKEFLRENVSEIVGDSSSAVLIGDHTPVDSTHILVSPQGELQVSSEDRLTSFQYTDSDSDSSDEGNQGESERETEAILASTQLPNQSTEPDSSVDTAVVVKDEIVHAKEEKLNNSGYKRERVRHLDLLGVFKRNSGNSNIRNDAGVRRMLDPAGTSRALPATPTQHTVRFEAVADESPVLRKSRTLPLSFDSPGTNYRNSVQFSGLGHGTLPSLNSVESRRLADTEWYDQKQLSGAFCLVPKFPAPRSAELAAILQPNPSLTFSVMKDCPHGSVSTTVGGRPVQLKYRDDVPAFGNDVLERALEKDQAGFLENRRCLMPTFAPPPPAVLWKLDFEGKGADHFKMPLSHDSQVATPACTNTQLLNMNYVHRTHGSNVGTTTTAQQENLKFRILSVEIFCSSRSREGHFLLPNPKFDCVQCIGWCLNDSVSSATNEDVKQTSGILCIPASTFVSGAGNPRIQSENLRRSLHSFTPAPGTSLSVLKSEVDLLESFVELVRQADPDILTGFEVQRTSLGYLVERGSVLGMNMLQLLSSAPEHPPPRRNEFDSYSEEHESGIFIHGRLVLNLWRRMRAELKLSSYSVCSVTENLLKETCPYFSQQVLTSWYSKITTMHKVLQYILRLSVLNQTFLQNLDLVRRTAESARLYGIDFFSVLTRGSQYHVEAALVKASHRRGYLLLSPNKGRVASQAPMAVIPLVMEPVSGFYEDPVVVLDFQSLYPSMMIAYNLCYSTIIGSLKSGLQGTQDTSESLGTICYPEKFTALATFSHFLRGAGLDNFASWGTQMRKSSVKPIVSPNGSVFCAKEVRTGILPQMLKEILETRLMVKRAMKRYANSGDSYRVLRRVLDARQLSIKLLANVIYGYTAAGFSGRMPMAELADAVVQCGRSTLEHAISVINNRASWNAKVVYGDTDSMFVQLPGRSKEEAIRLGQEMATVITAMNPPDVVLKFEKVYYPCILASKKRYVGAAFESVDQLQSHFDAKVQGYAPLKV